MKHKFWTVLLALAAILCLGLTGCKLGGGSSSGGNSSGGSGTTPSGHTHTYAETWSSDESGHWHAATCHPTERSDEAPHTYENGVCTECHYAHQNHTYENGVCTECHYAHQNHTYDNGVCTECHFAHQDHTYQNGVCTECHFVHQNHTYENGVCTECHYAHQNHTYENGVCTECHYAHQNHTYEKGVCTECHYAHKDHTYGDDNTCSVCGAKKPPYTKSEDGTKIYMGEYPQTEVKESGLKGMLGMEAGANPTSSNAGKWTDYGYYISGSVQSYMWYIDVEYQGGRYRGVYFTRYRPYLTTYSSSTDNSYQDDNGYNTNTVYWFKYEPIEWRILEEKDGTALLMANIILDSQQYYRTTSGTRTVNGKTVYPNNYKESDIRAWLTETFYETAFDELAQQIIETTTVDNSASTTSSSSNSYACENTQDKVFLLSYKDVLNTSYGFSSSYSTYDTARRLKSTDYAKSQGCWQSTDSSYRGNGWWWLRSPYYNYSNSAYYVRYDGYASDYHYTVYNIYGGVVPALRIRL